MRLVIVGAALLLSAQASAQQAPFCVVNSWGTQCHYYNADVCRQNASSSGGMCVANQQQAQPPQNAQANFGSAMQQGLAFGAQMQAQRDAAMAREAQRQAYEAQADLYRQQAEAREAEVRNQANVLYRCTQEDGIPLYTTTPAVNCVVVSVR